ncbi:hypothetical protein AB3S75_015905 [Citrus x aurantiifolia]
MHAVCSLCAQQKPTPRRSTTTPSAFTVTSPYDTHPPCDTSSTVGHCATPTPPRNTTALPALHRLRYPDEEAGQVPMAFVLELKYPIETNSLPSLHQYVPWVVVDGQPLTEDYENFIGYICKAYNGNVVPKACGNLSLIPSDYGVKQEHVFSTSYNKEIRIKSAITMWIRKMSMIASL